MFDKESGVPGRLPGKRAAITGGAAGIGLAIAQRFAGEGASIAVCDPDRARLAALQQERPDWLYVAADVSIESQVAEFFEACRARFGALDCLVNNAGISGPTAGIESIALADWEAVYACNVRGAYLCTRAAVGLLKSAGGSIIMMSSLAGRVGVPFRTPYASAKWALIGLTKSLAVELGEHKIRVNAILPGLTRGPRLERVIEARAASSGRTFEEQVAVEVSAGALGELVEPEDIASAALYLASDEGRRVTGVSLPVDAGLESATFR